MSAGRLFQRNGARWEKALQPKTAEPIVEEAWCQFSSLETTETSVVPNDITTTRCT